jgi:hypothetical protein
MDCWPDVAERDLHVVNFQIPAPRNRAGNRQVGFVFST